MVAILNISKSIWATFEYNESKVTAGVADLLSVRNYPMDTDKMQQQHRLNMLLKTAAKRESVLKPCVHISLNFAPGEDLSQVRLRVIADDYMKAIGFENQPYLVYQHFDAGHPHIHIVSVKIDPSGNRLETHLTGDNSPGNIRRKLEKKHNLVQAQAHQKELYQLKPVSATKAEYGKNETRKAIYNILVNVLPRYNYTSLGELNAILKGYHIAADPGSKESRIRQHKGLVYRILDPDGIPVGVPVPASRILDDGEATLKKLEDRFVKNKLARVGTKPRIKHLVDLCFRKFPQATFTDLQDQLAKSNIRLVGHNNEFGQIFGLTYVDYMDKIAINGNSLGKAYGANGIAKRCFAPPLPQPSKTEPISDNQLVPISLFQRLVELNLIDNDQLVHGEPTPDYASSSGGGLFEILARGEVLAHWLPYELRRKKKRRRKRNPYT